MKRREKSLQFNDRLNTFSDNCDFLTHSRMKKAGSGLFLRGEAEFQNEFGETLFKKSNIIVVGGRRFAMEKLFNVAETSNKITLNSLFSVNETEPTYTGIGPRKEKAICLFGVGRGGSDMTFGSVINPSGREYNLYDMVPLRYVLQSSDLSSAEKEDYALKVSQGDYYGYYLKQFEDTPTLNMKVEGEDYQVSLDDNTRLDEYGQYIDRPDVEVWMEMLLQIDSVDVREYFIATETIDNARINELALYFGYKEDLGVWSDYYALECFSKLTFNNEPLANQTKILNIVYRIYV